MFDMRGFYSCALVALFGCTTNVTVENVLISPDSAVEASTLPGDASPAPDGPWGGDDAPDASPWQGDAMATDSSPDVSDAPSSPVGFACYGSWPNGSPIDCYFDTAWAGGDGGVCATYQPYGRYQEKPHCPAQGLVGCCVGRAADRTTAYCVYTTPAPDCGFCPPGVTCTWEHMSP